MTNHCPVHRDDHRKTAMAADGAGPGAITGFAPARALLRDSDARQAAFKAELVTRFGGKHKPILFLHGAEHQRQRAATARFFTPRAVQRDHRPMIEAETRRLIRRFQDEGEAFLDAMSLSLAVKVAANVVGLTEGDMGGMTRRLERLFDSTAASGRGRFQELAGFVRGQVAMQQFHWHDVKPAIRARRKAPREDVISHLIAEGYPDRAILTECVTYGAAGMVTTREFIALAGWHLIEHQELGSRFLAADEAGQIEILEEILRLEPVVGTLRRVIGDHGEAKEIDVRAANVDEAAFGGCPHQIDPDRSRSERVGTAGLAFGDGPHRCPGAQLAMVESALFLDQLLKVPGLRIIEKPVVRWAPMISGYEIRGARIACEHR